MNTAEVIKELQEIKKMLAVIAANFEKKKPKTNLQQRDFAELWGK